MTIGSAGSLQVRVIGFEGDPWLRTLTSSTRRRRRSAPSSWTGWSRPSSPSPRGRPGASPHAGAGRRGNPRRALRDRLGDRQGWSLDDAEGAWLTLHAYSRYRVTRIAATFAQHTVTLTVASGAGPYSITAGQLVVVNSLGIAFAARTQPPGARLRHAGAVHRAGRDRGHGEHRTLGGGAPALAGVTMAWDARTVSAVDEARPAAPPAVPRQMGDARARRRDAGDVPLLAHVGSGRRGRVLRHHQGDLPYAPAAGRSRRGSRGGERADQWPAAHCGAGVRRGAPTLYRHARHRPRNGGGFTITGTVTFRAGRTAPSAGPLSERPLTPTSHPSTSAPAAPAP